MSRGSHSRSRMRFLVTLAVLVLGCTGADREGALENVVFEPATITLEGDLRLLPRDLPKGLTTLRFGVTPYLSQEVIRRQFEPVAVYASRHLGMKVELDISRSYEEQVRRVVAGELDIVLLPPLSYIMAKRGSPKLQVVAQELARGNTTFSSYIVVPADSSFMTLADLKNRRMVFVDEFSTSGFLFPYSVFLNNGIDPEKDFSQVRFAGSHLQAIAELSLGSADAIAIGSGMLAEAAKHKFSSGPIDPAEFRILFKAGRIPFDGICVRDGFPASGVRKIQETFIRLNTRTPPGRRVLSRTAQINGFIPVTDEAYGVVREILKQVEEHRGKNR